MWAERFAKERIRLVGALGGHLTEGGIVADIQHIGASSIPGLLDSTALDIALTIWPFPLPTYYQSAIEALGYRPQPPTPDSPAQHFRHEYEPVDLFFLELGSGDEYWQNCLLLPHYLRNNESARQRFAACKQALGTQREPPGKAQLFQEFISPAREWWVSTQGFTQVESVAETLQGLERPWRISSGWALDLFMGQVSRVHHDVDVEIARTDHLVLQRHLLANGWRFVTPFEDRLEPWPTAMGLEPPRHQAHAYRDGWFIDFLITEVSDGIWRYRRNPAVIRTLERATLHTAQGLPYLAPEIALLFKSRSTKERPKDLADFEAVYKFLEPERLAWLRWALTATDPAHPWLEIL